MKNLKKRLSYRHEVSPKDELLRPAVKWDIALREENEI
jgi:hypothetical protein